MLLPGAPMRGLITSLITTSTDDRSTTSQSNPQWQWSEQSVNTAAQPIAAEQWLSNIMKEIAIQQERYRQEWQHQQNEANFHPEYTVPQFFKAFYGDMQILRK